MTKKKSTSRRDFIKLTSASTAGAIVLPTIVPSTVFGKTAPSNQINIGMIGTGRQGIHANLNNGFLKLDNCRVIATNDVDKWRMNQATKIINDKYSNAGKNYNGVTEYDDYRELLNNKDIDAVMISTTDHWHAPQAIAAAQAGKHVCMEKAFTIAPAHGNAVVGAIEKAGVANRLDSEFRSMKFFHKTVELVHNGAIGDLTEVHVGVPKELNGTAVGPQETMPIPEELNYDMWLGPAFPSPYTEKRVHESGNYSSRPGWLRIPDYCNGMITNWGAHLMDIASWGMKREYEVPVSVEGKGEFNKGLWSTLGNFELEYTYADGFKMKYECEVPYVKFFGTEGWIKIRFPKTITTSNDEAILNFKGGKDAVSYKSTLSDKADFLRSIETGKPSLEPLKVGNNMYFIAAMGLTAITLDRKLNWDPNAGQFINDHMANTMLNRPFRTKWLDQDVIDWMNKYQKVDLV